jgi:hypothetical protein
MLAHTNIPTHFRTSELAALDSQGDAAKIVSSPARFATHRIFLKFHNRVTIGTLAASNRLKERTRVLVTMFN